MMEAAKDILRWGYWYPHRILIQHLPIPLVYAGCRAQATLLSAGPGARRFERELADLGLAQGLDGRAVREVVWEACFSRLCTEAEVLLFPRFNPANIARHTTVEGLDRLDTALKNGRGVMLILAHYGANQMVMSAVGHRGYRMDQLGAPASVWDRVINDHSTTPMKRRGLEIRAALEDTLPANILDPEKKLKEALKGLKENHVLGVAADGAAGEGWIACPFLGRRIRLGKGPFGILKATGCEALPAFMVRDRSGRQCLQIGKPLALPTEMGKDAAISEGAARFAKVLEDYVRQRPGHYLHFLALRRRMAGLGDPPLIESADAVDALVEPTSRRLR